MQCHGEDCCGGSYPISPLLLALMDGIREAMACSIHASCGFRCRVHNIYIGSTDTSQHPLGLAGDMHLPAGGWTVDEMAQVAEAEMKLRGITGGIGKYSWGIHVDVRVDGPARWDDR